MPPKHRNAPRTAVVFGHADGDGYLAAEVSRANLVAEGWVVNDVIVGPKITANSHFWERHFREWDFSNVDLALVVDIAFDFTDPTKSRMALSQHTEQFPKTRFLVIDHHPLPAGEWLPSNVTLQEASSVYRCCYGEPNDLMVIASICDHDEQPVEELITPGHRILAHGINRAAADTERVAGDLLVSMLENQQWAAFFNIGSEPNESHRSFYRRRTRASKPSAALEEVIKPRE